MLTVRTQGKRGSKGRLELFAMGDGEGNFTLRFTDYGSYGKVRWDADFGLLKREDIVRMAADLQALASGQCDTTHVPFEELEAGEHEPEGEPDTEARAMPAAADESSEGSASVTA